jgi:hypothetical protein
MDQILKGFFDTASQKAGETIAAQDAAAQREAQQESAREANKRLLKAQIDAELGPILDVLRSLPAKGGKRFKVRLNDETDGYLTQAQYGLEVGYDATPRNASMEFDGYESREPRLRLRMVRDNEGLRIYSTQCSIVYETEEDGQRRTRGVCDDFESARRELAIGLGSFAADRVTEIGEKLGAGPEAQLADAGGINVFARPLQIKNAAASAKKKHFWQFW